LSSLNGTTLSYLTSFCDYNAALPALEAYSAAGGVVWVQGAIQGFSDTDCYPLPFGGQACIDFAFEDPIVQACNPIMIGVEDPIEGNYASHTRKRACQMPRTSWL
jgi:hypothetical protein